MGVIARAKSFFGRGGGQLTVLPTVATPEIPADQSVFTVTGTTPITGFGTTLTGVNPGRHITLIGTHATGPAFTDTAIGSTANGKIHLSAALTLANGTAIQFVQLNNGAWAEVARAANG
jgi:hypothetical protein